MNIHFTLFQGYGLIIGNLNSVYSGFIFLTYSKVGVPKTLIISTN